VEDDAEIVAYPEAAARSSKAPIEAGR